MSMFPINADSSTECGDTAEIKFSAVSFQLRDICRWQYKYVKHVQFEMLEVAFWDIGGIFRTYNIHVGVRKTSMNLSYSLTIVSSRCYGFS